MNHLKSFLFLLMLVSLTVWYYLVLLLWRGWFFIRGQHFPSNEAHKVASRYCHKIFSFTPGWRLDISGEENLITSYQNKGCVLIANHESSVDILAIYYLGIPFKWLSKRELFLFPAVGQAMRWARYIQVRRGEHNSHKKALNDCSQLIGEGHSVLLFPEGTRSTLGHPKTFKKGAFILASKNQVPVVPIVLLGAGRLMKKNTLCPNPGVVRVKVLPPVFKKPEEALEDFTQRVESLVVKEHQLLSQQHKSLS